MSEAYDVIIVGAGPAGLTGAIYCAQAGLKVVALEKECMGGQIMNVEKIENYAGFPQGIAGAELGGAMTMQAMNYGAEIKLAEVQGLELKNGSKLVKTAVGDFPGKAVILTGGARPKKLGAPGEAEFTGKGVIYCAFCEGGQFAGKVVAVAGGGDAGITEALLLANLASRVIIIEVLPQINANALLQKRLRENTKIDIICGSTIEAIAGDATVKELKVFNAEKKETVTLPVDGLLVHVGVEPQTGYLRGVVPLDGQGQILVNGRMETETPGVLAAGDIRHDSPRQVGAAVGDAVVAATTAIRYLKSTA
ncbi:MAG: FAD-dependent oxidoreductase [Chloroflexota bacterium]